MPLEFDIVGLSQEHQERCISTVGPNTFFALVIDALVSGKQGSVVRMGDGERILFKYCCEHLGATMRAPTAPLSDAWLEDFCCKDIPAELLRDRIRYAAEDCTWFAPQIMGMWRREWAIAEVFRPRPYYVDNWFVRQWTQKMQEQLFQAAVHVLVLHRDESVRQRLFARIQAVGAQAEEMAMSHWNQADDIIQRAQQSNARLVLFSGGPANKYIAPPIGNSGKLVLDIGQALAKEWM